MSVIERNRTDVTAPAIVGDEPILPILEIEMIGEALHLAGAIGQALLGRSRRRRKR